MKPSLLALGMAVVWLAAWHPAHGQTPVGIAPQFMPPPYASPLDGAALVSGPKIWGTIPPPKPLPYGYWWDEYRGADIEHPLYAPRHSHSAQRAAHTPNIFSSFCCWFDKLFHKNCAAQPTPCTVCQAPDMPPPPLPSMEQPPYANPPADSFSFEPTPLLPTPPPAIPLPAPPPATTAGPTFNSAPPPSEPEVSSQGPPGHLPDEPARPATSPSPTTITEASPAPLEPGAALEPQLPPARSPLVELAPEIPVPADPVAPAAPRNVIPSSPQTPPRNVIPPQKRGVSPGA